MRNVTHIIIHCAATPNGKAVTPEQIDSWHKARGFKRREAAMQELNPHLESIGYHYVVGVDGEVHTGRGLEEIGAHVAGSNARSVGVCMIGTDKYTQAQWDALSSVVESMRAIWPDAKVCGHRDFSPDKDGDGVVEPWEWTKTCPGFDVYQWMHSGQVPPEEHLLA